MKKRRNKKTGFARTKRHPLLNHPAYYQKKNADDIEYVTFTHSQIVNLDNEEIITQKLNVNINKSLKEIDRISYVVPRVYTGKRSSLKDEMRNYRIDKKDKNTISRIFSTSKRYPVSYTTNSKNKKMPK